MIPDYAKIAAIMLLTLSMAVLLLLYTPFGKMLPDCSKITVGFCLKQSAAK